MKTTAPTAAPPLSTQSTTQSRPVIALFGGSFDPPHRAHQQIAVYMLEQQLVDQVWFVPVKHHPFGKTVSSDAARRQMLQLVLQDQLTATPALAGRLRVEEYELHQAGTSYTIQTLRHCRQQYPDWQFGWVMGSDNVALFPRWQDHQQILVEFGVWIYPRAGSLLAAPQDLPVGMRYLAAAPQVTTSSTQIRQAVAAGQVVTNWVLPAVADYITRQRLYHLPTVAPAVVRHT